MAPSLLQQRRTHNTLLFQKLLNLRDGASPLTLVFDTLEQRAGPIVREFVRRAKVGKSKIIFISFGTLPKKLSFTSDVFISATAKQLAALRTEILSHLPAPTAAAQPQKYLIILDTLNPLASTHPSHLSPFLSSLLLTPQISLLATYHTDIPLSPSANKNPYVSDPLTTLAYLATAILTVQSLAQVVARKHARDRSVQEPVFGITEDREGVLIGLKGNEEVGGGGVVVEMEIRRKSGRGVVEVFVLSPAPASAKATGNSTSNFSTIQLLDDHVLYAALPLVSGVAGGDGGEDVETTFSMGLTDKQKRDREGVVLPYFDAQKEGGAAGPGDGGRILYEMGEEDREDFDDEEDEI